MSKRRKRDDEADPEADDRPPICPACGVTQGFVVEGEGFASSASSAASRTRAATLS